MFSAFASYGFLISTSLSFSLLTGFVGTVENLSAYFDRCTKTSHSCFLAYNNLLVLYHILLVLLIAPGVISECFLGVLSLSIVFIV